MTHFFAKTPLLILFCLSIIPIAFIGLSPGIWAYINVIIFSFFALWAFSITKLILAKNNYDSDLKLRKFSGILIIATAYIIFLSVYYANTYNNYDEPGWFLLLILIGHSFLAYSIFYLAYFIAKTISTVERKGIVKFSDYAGYFFLLFIFPIGIWWLNPKIKLVANT
jgi:hypothetical protein